MDIAGWKRRFQHQSDIAEGNYYLLVVILLLEADVSSNGINADLTASLSLGNGTSSIDGIRLLDCDENVLTQFVW